jgi:hypothetical protein
MTTLLLLALAFVPSEYIPTLFPPQAEIDALVVKLNAEAMEEVPDHGIVYRQSVRVFYHIERDKDNDRGYWGVWLVIRYWDGLTKDQVFKAGALKPPHPNPPNEWERR